MQLATVTPQGDQVEQQLRTQARTLIEKAAGTIIINRLDLSEAIDLGGAISIRKRDLEDERKRLTKPFNDGVKAINQRFKAVREPLEEAVAVLKGKIITFQNEEERRADQERKRLDAQQQKQWEEAEKKRLADEKKNVVESGEEYDRPAPPPAPAPAPPPAPAPAPPPAPVSTFKRTAYGESGASATKKKIWKAELVDIALVPVQYVMLDHAAVNLAVRAGVRDIPGVRIFQADDLAFR